MAKEIFYTSTSSNAIITTGLPIKRSNRVKQQKKFFDESSQPMNNESINQILKLNRYDSSVDCEMGPMQVTEQTLVNVINDEDAWLDALEKGDLNDNGEIPQSSRNPVSMTVRQKKRMGVAAGRASSSKLVEDITVKEEISDEMRRKREEKNERRRMQAMKKAEEWKRQTIEKLVKVSTVSSTAVHSKPSKKATGVAAPSLPASPMIRYMNSATAITLSYPRGFEFPLLATSPAPPVARRSCAVCGAARKYDCKRTGVPLCSLRCYRENAQKALLGR